VDDSIRARVTGVCYRFCWDCGIGLFGSGGDTNGGQRIHIYDGLSAFLVCIMLEILFLGFQCT